MKGKLAAFTLFELMLGMLLSAIVIGMVYSAWFLFSRVYAQYMKDAAEQSQVVAFRSVLSSDVERACLMKIEEGEVVLLDSMGMESLRYAVCDEGVVRKGVGLDTFRFGRSLLSAGFEGGMVKDSLADALAFSFVFRERAVTVSVTKYYSSEQLFMGYQTNRLYNK